MDHPENQPTTPSPMLLAAILRTRAQAAAHLDSMVPQLAVQLAAGANQTLLYARVTAQLVTDYAIQPDTRALAVAQLHAEVLMRLAQQQVDQTPATIVAHINQRDIPEGPI